MGSIVKSIGKAIKKVGKSVKKIVKKIGPALVVAAAVYTGVSFLGAGGMAGGVGSLTPTNFTKGLTEIGKFFLPSLGEQQAATSFSTEVGLGSASAIADAAPTAIATGVNPLTSTADAFSGVSAVGSTATNVLSSAKSTISDYIFASNGEMSTGQALAYMAKLNMYKTGADIVLSLFDTSEQDLLEQKHKYDLEIMDKQAEIEMKMQGISQAHDAAMQEAALEARYAYGAPSGGGSGTFTHPSLMPAGSQQMQRMPAGQMQLANLGTQFTPQPAQQSIGQPTLGRSRTRNFETPVPSAASPRPPGLLTQAARKEIV